MGLDSQTGRWLRTWVRVWVHALTYAVFLTTLIALGAMTFGIATGGGFARGNVFLFVAGWIVLAYATVKLWPSSPEDVEPTTVEGISPTQTRFESIATAMPPARFVEEPDLRQRMTVDGKLMLTSVLVLGLSFAIETLLGVG